MDQANNLENYFENIVKCEFRNMINEDYGFDYKQITEIKLKAGVEKYQNIIICLLLSIQQDNMKYIEYVFKKYPQIQEDNELNVILKYACRQNKVKFIDFLLLKIGENIEKDQLDLYILESGHQTLYDYYKYNFSNLKITNENICSIFISKNRTLIDIYMKDPNKFIHSAFTGAVKSKEIDLIQELFKYIPRNYDGLVEALSLLYETEDINLIELPFKYIKEFRIPGKRYNQILYDLVKLNPFCLVSEFIFNKINPANVEKIKERCVKGSDEVFSSKFYTSILLDKKYHELYMMSSIYKTFNLDPLTFVDRVFNDMFFYEYVPLNFYFNIKYFIEIYKVNKETIQKVYKRLIENFKHRDPNLIEPVEINILDLLKFHL